MRILNEDILEENGLRIEFAGWTNSKNTNYRELADEIHDNQIEKKDEIIPIFKFAFFTALYSPLQSLCPVFYFLLGFCGIAAA